MNSFISKEAVIALLKTLFVNWWKSKGKTLASDEWSKINDLINEKVATVIGPRKGILVKSPDGNVWRIQVDNEGILFSTKETDYN